MQTGGTGNISEWLDQVQAGDEQAFTRLFHAYRDKLYSFIFHLSGSAVIAEDTVQEVFLKIWRDRSDMTGIDNFNAYLFRMAQNEAINGFRRQSRQALILAEISRQSDNNNNTEETVLGREAQILLQEALDKLPAQQRRVFELSRNEGLKYEEIATLLGISTSTVRNHMVQALKNIREFMMAFYFQSTLYYLALLYLLDK